jgi:hypothetical protein
MKFRKVGRAPRATRKQMGLAPVATVQHVKQELSKLRRLRTLGYATQYGRIEELESFIETNGASHGY